MRGPLAILISLALVSASAHSEQSQQDYGLATVSLESTQEEQAVQISGSQLSEPIPIFKTPLPNGEWKKLVLIKGSVFENTEKLTLNGIDVPIDSKHQFDARLEFTENEITAIFVSAQKKTKVKRESRFKIKVIKDEVTLGFHPSFSLGLSESFNHYEQNGINNLDQWLLTMKGGIQFPVFTENWNVGISGYASLTSFPHADSRELHYLGMNFRLARNLGEWAERTHFFIATGFYYTTTFSPTSKLGYRNIFGPQVYPTAVHEFKDGTVLSGYFKYSPINSEFALLNVLSNREIALGFAYQFLIFERSFIKKMGTSFDFSRLDLDLGTKVASLTYSLGVTLSF